MQGSQTLKNKKILVISPQDWGDIHLSKHHYAIELADMGNTVFFLGPILSRLPGKPLLAIVALSDRLYNIKYTAWIPAGLRFKFPWLYHLLMRKHIRYILNQIHTDLDIVWCFDAHHFENLRAFGARLSIFHPVDLYDEPKMCETRRANLVLATTDDILKNFSGIDIPAYKIEHGLANCFLKHCPDFLERPDKDYSVGRQLCIGYIGNLLMEGIDRVYFRQIVSENAHVIFHLWGPYQIESSNLAGAGQKTDRETNLFIKFLLGSNNVILHGPTIPSRIAVGFKNMDGFFMCYDLEKESNKGADSHKILEYLSTGNVVVSHWISGYQDKPGLVEMAPTDGSHELPVLFKKVISNLEFFNRRELREMRIHYAMNHAYSIQIQGISDIVNRYGLL